MKTINDGGHAFPVATYETPNGEFVYGHTGMTLRDYFAAQVITTIYLVAADEMEKNGCPPDWRYYVAKDAYALADAMIQVRSK